MVKLADYDRFSDIFFFLFFFFFLPFNTLFSPSSDIQRVGEGHPPACLTNYRYGILMVNYYACSPLSFIYHAFFKRFLDTCTQPRGCFFPCVLVFDVID